MRRLGVLLAMAGLLAAGASPAHASTTIRGTVVKGKGYTVVALSRDGSAATAKLAASGAFKLVLAGTRGRAATLHLVRRNGSYYGPIVLSAARRVAFLTLSGRSVSLGKIRLRGGYAAVEKRPAARAVNTKLRARANSRGKPAGAGKSGLVERPRGASAAQSSAGDQPGEDSDADGLANTYDVDDDGDEVIDPVDADSQSSAGLHPILFTNMLTRLGIDKTLNVNAGAAVTKEAVDEELRAQLLLDLWFYDSELPGRQVTSVDIECFGLVPCRRGDGIAEIDPLFPVEADFPNRPKRWLDYDPNGDGLPNLVLNAQGPGGGDRAARISVYPRATTDQVNIGDSLVFVVSAGGETIRVPATINSAFITPAAIKSYDDGSGPKPISYPVSPGDPGTFQNPAPVASDKITLTHWRPQRPGIEGAESQALIDMGHLRYGVVLDVLESPDPVFCGPENYSNLSSGLAMRGTTAQAGGDVYFLIDGGDDAPPDSARTLSFTFDIGACLRSKGLNPSGANVGIGLNAQDLAAPPSVVGQAMRVQLP